MKKVLGIFIALLAGQFASTALGQSFPTETVQLRRYIDERVTLIETAPKAKRVKQMLQLGSQCLSLLDEDLNGFSEAYVEVLQNCAQAFTQPQDGPDWESFKANKDNCEYGDAYFSEMGDSREYPNHRMAALGVRLLKSFGCKVSDN